MRMLKRLCSTVGAGCAALVAMVSGPAALGQYCTASAGNCAGILGERISRVVLGPTDNNQGAGNGPTGCYTDFTSISTNVTEGGSLTISVYNPAYFAEDACTAWVDWNHNSVFDVGSEEFILTNTFADGSRFDGTITVPPGALVGPTRLRVRLVYDEVPPACGATDYGETEDYTLNVLSATQGACCIAGSPTCTITTLAACAGTYQGNSTACSPTNPCGGACCTGTVCTATVSTGCVGGQFINGGVCGPTSCMYCTASATDCATGDERIVRVAIGSIDNDQGLGAGPTGCYTDFTSISTALPEGTSQAITIYNGNGFAADECTVWVDWNRDFVFGNTASGEEFVLTSTLNGAVFNGTVTVPAGAPLGATRMRIRLVWDETPAACGGSDYGETEDYSVVVTSALQGACCTAGSAACAITTSAACTGMYQGNASTCAPTNPCGGTCCTGAVCTATISTGCAGGLFVAGAVCGPASCMYCAAGSDDCTGDERISRVQFHTIDNNQGTANGPAGCYTDFTSISATLNPGQSYAITVHNAAGFNEDQASVWVDWNRDFVFGDVASGEETVLLNALGDGSVFTGTVPVPAGAPLGSTRLRIRLLYDGPYAACGNVGYGEVEDYTVIVEVATGGACCTAGSPACTITSSGTCSGTYQGNGSTCAPSNPCGGSCCTGATCTATVSTGCAGGSFVAGGICGPSSCTYCEAGAGDCGDGLEVISRVIISGIDNNQPAGGMPAGCYTDFTAISTTVAAGVSYPIVVSNEEGFVDDVCVVWVDWNHDFVFGDAASGERFTLNDSFGDGFTFDGVIDVPATALVGPTRMRVRLLYDAVANPCGNAAYGEVEDYTLVVGVSTDGACCGAAGACTVTTQAGCASPGVFRLGVPCGPSVCNGACCHPTTAICTVTTTVDCTSPRVFQGAATVCAPTNPCPIPPQTNDECATPIALALGTAYQGNNSQATGDGTEGPGGSCYLTSPDHFTKAIWFTFQAPASTNYLVSACGTTFDTVLSVFSSSGVPACTNLTQIGCDDDSCTGTDTPSPGPGPGAGTASVIASVAMTGGTTYYIRLAAWDLAGGGGPYGIVVQYAAGVTVGSCCIGTVCSLTDAANCTGTFTPGGSCSPDPCGAGPTGVCCRGSTCSTDLALQTQATCAATVTGTAGAKFVVSAACGGTNHRVPCCYADYTQNGVRDVSDIFAFLTDWFAVRPWAVVGGTGTGAPAVSHIFSFLTDWFAGGCP